ncbi:MAG: DNA recombination protein RmuC, partial [Kiritimatiellae bacterium]|nr:DNA recombination protein RmuC [Kiritimatiellia bacterium]
MSKTVNLCPALENENQQLKKMLAMMEDNVRQRLADKDIHCRQLLESKDAECARFVREKEKLYAEMVRTLEEKFANLAAVTLENKTKDLSAANRENLAAALKPLSEQMKLFQEATQKAQKENQGMSVSIRRDVEAIGQMARDLTGFATALKSGTRVQGRAGEDILAEKLRQAGLEENVNFFLQKGTRHDRPDAQVCDTENRWIIIDSKV